MSKNTNTVYLGAPESITIHCVEGLEARLTQLLKSQEGAESVHIDLSKVQELDGAGVQWLAHLEWLCKRVGKVCQLHAPSDEVLKQSKLFGQGELL